MNLIKLLSFICTFCLAMALVGFSGAWGKVQEKSKKLEKFYITAPWICDNPLISYGNDRLEAVVNSGITVWTEEEWKEFEKVKEDKP